ncbi:hypothetical protein REA11_23345 [Serratia sp. MF1(2023)]|nr:hypothetical protein [Serratia sp. MF1(2023)]MDQ7101732.1 hypothetical protein [Serratia sp. MF2]
MALIRMAATPTILLPSLAIAHPDIGSDKTTPADMANSTLPNTPSDNASPPLIVAILELKLPKHNPNMKNMLDIAKFFSFIIDIMVAPLSD